MVRLMGMRLLAAILLLTGCAAPVAASSTEKETPALRGDVAFSEAERARIEAGNVWLAERVGAAPYVIVWDLPHPAYVGDAGPLVVVRGCSLPTHAGAGDTNGHVEVDPDDIRANGDEDIAIVAAHEFGHARGLRHLPETVQGIMNPDTEGTLTWTPADEANCLADGVCH